MVSRLTSTLWVGGGVGSVGLNVSFGCLSTGFMVLGSWVCCSLVLVIWLINGLVLAGGGGWCAWYMNPKPGKQNISAKMNSVQLGKI